MGRKPPEPPAPEPAPYKSAALPMSYEGVSSRPPTDRTPLLGFGDQAGPRPWPRRSCSCVRRACPASSLSRAFRALRSVPETPKGREPSSVRRPLGRSWISGSTKGRRSSNRDYAAASQTWASYPARRRTDKSRRSRRGALSSIRYVPWSATWPYANEYTDAIWACKLFFQNRVDSSASEVLTRAFHTMDSHGRLA